MTDRETLERHQQVGSNRAQYTGAFGETATVPSWKPPPPKPPRPDRPVTVTLMHGDTKVTRTMRADEAVRRGYRLVGDIAVPKEPF